MPVSRQRLIETVGRSARLRVLNELKRTAEGLPVRALAERLGMSYMGVKDICTDLAKRGLLDTWRHSGKAGRPQMLYRLTERAQELYPTASNGLTLGLLQTAQQLYGPSAAEKMLLVTFQRQGEELRGRMRGETVPERAASLVRLREEAGCMSELVEVGDGKLRIVEHHSPIREVQQAYPIVARLETELFQRLLGRPVQRVEEGVSGLYQVTFTFAAG